MAAKRPKCFIAMAFAKADTEILWKQSIKPLLRELGITPVIVSESQKNDDLTEQIRDGIRGCDFCIADLTYARQSVYYEAGFAEGLGKAVILTSRSDHFKNTDDALRVHFDLSVKNIIDWPKPESKTFQKRLRARIRGSFLVSWLRSQAISEEEESAVREFQNASLQERLYRVRKAIVSAVSSDFNIWKVYAPPPFHSLLVRGKDWCDVQYSRATKVPSAAMGIPCTFASHISTGKGEVLLTLEAVNRFPESSLVKKDAYRPWQLATRAFEPKGSYLHVHVVAMITRSRTSSMQVALANMHWDSERQVFTRGGEDYLRKRGFQSWVVPIVGNQIADYRICANTLMGHLNGLWANV